MYFPSVTDETFHSRVSGSFWQYISFVEMLESEDNKLETFDAINGLSLFSN